MGLRRYQKNLIRLGVVVVLALVGVVSVMLFHPISSRWLDRKIAQQIEQLTGLDVTFHEAVFYLAQQRCVIKELALHSRDFQHRTVLTAGKVDIIFSLHSILFREEKSLRSVEIQRPSALPLIVSEGRIYVGENLEFLQRFFEAANRETGKPYFTLKYLSLKDARILLTFALHPSRKPQVIADNVNLQFVLRDDGSRLILVNGAIPPLDNAELRASFTRESQEPQTSFMVVLMKPRSAISLANISTPVVTSKQLTLNGTLAYDDKHTTVTAVGKIYQPLVALGTEAELYDDDILNFSFQSAYTPSTGEMMLETVHMLSNDLELYTSGSLTLASPFDLNVAVRAERIPTPLLEYFKTLFEYEGSGIDISDARLRLGASVRGQLAGEALPAFKGWVDVKGVRIWYPDIGEPLQHVQGKLEFENNQLTFARVRGDIGQGSVVLNGHLTGNQVFWEPDVLEVGWEAWLRAEDVFAAVPATQRGRIAHAEVVGEIRGAGELRKTFTDLRFPPSSNITASGILELNNVTVAHPLLPAPIQELRGQMNIKNDRIQFSNVEGEIGESTVLASGSILGNEAFWMDSQLDARVVITTTGNALLSLLKQFAPGQALPASVSGKAVVDAHLKTPLYTLNPFSMDFKTEFKESCVEIEKPIVHAWLKTLEGTIEARDGVVTLTHVSGQVGDIPFSLSGWVRAEGARLILSSEAKLESLKSLLPTLLDKFRVGGSVALTAEIDVSAQANQPVRSQISGEIQAQDATFAYADMPVDITHINGTFSFHQNELRMLNVRCWSGRSKDCEVNGAVRFAPRQTVFIFHVWMPWFYLDEWTKNWPKHKETILGETAEVTGETSPTLKVSGSIDAAKASYGLLEGNEFQGSFDYEFFPFAPNTFYYDNVDVSLYQGNLTGSGSIIFPKGDAIYEAEVDAKRINTRELLEALREEKQTIVGMLSGTLSLVGQGHDAGRIQGSGKFTVQDSRFIDTIVLKALGGVLRSPLFNDISFTQVIGDFALKNGAVHFSKFDLRNPMLQMKATGKIGFNKQVELDVYLAFLSAYFGRNIPILSDITAFIEQFGSKLLKFRILGTLDEPRVTFVPLSLDEINKILFPAGAH